MWSRKNKIILIQLALSLLYVTNSSLVNAQEEVIREHFDSAVIGRNRIININSVKGDIRIYQWDNQKVLVKVKIISKNQDPITAKKELQFARYNFLKTASGVNISNYFSFPSGINKIKSVIEVEYKIYLPDKVTLIINNEFGSCFINNLDAVTNINNKYGDIQLNNTSGQYRLFAKLCDINLNTFSGKFELISSNSNIILKDFNGQVSVENKVGKMIFEPGDEMEYLKVKSSYSEVSIIVSEKDEYNYDLTAVNSKIDLDNDFTQFPFQINSNEKKIYKSEKNHRLIQIATTFNPIKLNSNEKHN